MDVKFKFALLSPVSILSVSRPGKVIGNFIDRDELILVYVEYADASAVIQKNYFREEDLAAA